MITSSVSDGISLGPGRCLLVVQPRDTDASEKEFASILLSITEGQLDPTVVHPNFIISRVVECLGEIFLIGRLGEVALLSGGQLTRMDIVGPEDLGFLTDACTVGDTIYAVGMRRQVYSRQGAQAWSRADAGVLDESNDVEHVTGFRSVAAGDTGDVYAVGLDGEIWNRRAGKWRLVDSPTNAILEQVRFTSQGEVCAVGQAGVIVRGSGEGWSNLDQTDTMEDFWGLELFGGCIYLATGSQLFRLEQSDASLHMLVREGTSFARLRAGHGAIWSFGPDEVRWSADGDVWNDVEVPKARSRDEKSK